MKRYSSRSLSLMLLTTLLLWCSSFEMCLARRGGHWRHSGPLSASMLKKKGKSHGSKGHSHQHSSKPITKAPYHKSPAPPTMSPTAPGVDIPATPPVTKAPYPKVSPPKTLTPPAMTPTPRVDTPPVTKAPYPKVSPPISSTPPAVSPTPGTDTPSAPPVQKAPPLKSSTPHIIDIPSPEPLKSSSTFNVLNYGAKGDRKSDDTKAFEAAWGAACQVESSTMLIPSGYQFLVGPISFSGPYCQRNIVFQLDGTIVAPTNPEYWGSGLLWWLDFTKLVGITIQGKGTFDGSGSVWWNDAPYEGPVDDEKQMIIPLNDTVLQSPPMLVGSQFNTKMPSIKPTAVRFYGSINVTVTGITIQNSPQCHLKFDDCIGVYVYLITVSSPGDSPNTDGIHLQNSRDVLIHSASLACGDDCISIQTGCSNVYIHTVTCGPGHGISIGSLGRDNTKACVSNVTVRDANLQGTMTGVRIKTWQGGSGSVQGISFSNIQMSEVQLPIVIDQYYCDKSTCHNQTTAVAVSGITYQNIKGTYTVKPVHLACSDNLPCTDITLNGIQLQPLHGLYHLYDPYCWQSFGELTTPIVPPVACLQIGKPAKNKLHSDADTC